MQPLTFEVVIYIGLGNSESTVNCPYQSFVVENGVIGIVLS